MSIFIIILETIKLVPECSLLQWPFLCEPFREETVRGQLADP